MAPTSRPVQVTLNECNTTTPSSLGREEKRLKDGNALQGGWRRAAGARKQRGRDDRRARRFVGAARVLEGSGIDGGCSGARIGGGADMAHRTVGTRLQVTGEIVVRERHRGEREDVQRHQRFQRESQADLSGPHTTIIAPYKTVPGRTIPTLPDGTPAAITGRITGTRLAPLSGFRPPCCQRCRSGLPSLPCSCRRP